MENKNIKNEEMVVCSCCGKTVPADSVKYDYKCEPVCQDCLDNYVECECCGELVRESEVIEDYEYSTICPTCIDEYYVECCDCGKWIYADDASEIENTEDFVCPDCEDNYFRCEDCGCLIEDSNNIEVFDLDGDVQYHVCRDCYENGSYHYCADCDSVFEESDMAYNENDDCWYCDNCKEDHQIIGDYHSFDDWYDYYVDNRNESTLKGFELEVENSSDKVDNEEMAANVMNIMDDFIVFEHDGSLDSGFENISNPFTMQWLYKNEDIIKKMLKSFVDNGFRSHDPNTCGLHIHVNKQQLKTKDRSIDDVITNILIIMETFKDELIEFSRRSSYELGRWASFYTNENETLSYKLINKKKKSDGHDRYHALNLSNRNTIEFRIFRGTLKFESFMACIELVDNIVEIAKNEVINGLKWNDIISYAGKYVKEYSQNDREISSNTKVVIVPNPACPYKVGDVVRCHKYGDLYVGKIEYINEGDDTFGITNSYQELELENIIKNKTYVRGDIVIVRCAEDNTNVCEKPAIVVGLIDDFVQVRTYNSKCEEVIELYKMGKIKGEIDCWNYFNPYKKVEDVCEDEYEDIDELFNF